MLDEYGNYLPAPRERYWDNHPLHVPERPDPAEVEAYNRAFYAGIGSEQDNLLPGGMDAAVHFLVGEPEETLRQRLPFGDVFLLVFGQQRNKHKMLTILILCETFRKAST